jgi:effector-binding domain-containing protein
MTILKKALIAIVILLILAVGVGFFLPSAVHVERSITIDASKTTVYTLLNRYDTFNEWSPWHKRDPNTEYRFEGPDVGVGSKMYWTSEVREVGSGFQEITSSEPYSLIQVHLDFGDQGTAEGFYRIEPDEDQVQLTWGFDTEFGFDLIGRFFGFFIDSWVGRDFEEGLRSFKEFAEGFPKGDWSDIEISVIEVEPMTVAYVSSSCSFEHEAIAEALAAAYGEVMQYLGRNRLQPAGQPLAITVAHTRERWDFQACIPISAMPRRAPAVGANVQIGEIQGGRVVKATHVGPYETLGQTYVKLEAYFAAHGLVEGERPWEQYVSDPGDTEETKLITDVYYPIK